MLTEKDLREILNYSTGKLVLSLYLNTEPSGGNADAYRLRLRSMLKEVDAPKDNERIEQYFSREYDWSGRSVAVFSCADQDFFRAFPLAVPVRSRVRVSDHPHFKPLADLWDAFGGYGVALVDKQGARLFHFTLGELEEQKGYLGEEVKHTKSGGASSVAGMRGGLTGQTGYIEEVVGRNMKGAANFAAIFFESNHIRRVLIAGTEDNVSIFRSSLPKSWQSLVVGTFPMAMTASQKEVQAKTYHIGLEAEKAREAGLVNAAVTNAAKSGAGSVGLEQTLKAVAGHRVQTLLVKEGYFSSGAHCQNCGLLTGTINESCPICGTKMVRILDVVDYAVRSALQSGGDVEIVHENITLGDAGKIAAILRY
jgi:peptide subunit release factor 1 (eRF1)